MPIIRKYEISERRGLRSVLRCEIQRFPHDVIAWILYDFVSGDFKFHFPGAYTSFVVADEVRRFFDLVMNPNWRYEIKPFMKDYTLDTLFYE